ncbi:MAG: nuclear transport factor 2 family protein [Gemmatimonadota bacterium]|nr:nuclear transport factor 2 family protein [Gemmatimonadota bacterium]
MKTIVLCLALWLVACAPMPRASGAPDPNDTRAVEITFLLEESAEAWNRGDLDGFLLPYAAGAQTSFVGSSGIQRGKDAIRATYLRSYFSGGAPQSRLAFQNIEVRPLGAGHALAVGRYLLQPRDAASGVQSATGWFSLLLERQAEGWRIVHDHSS